MTLEQTQNQFPVELMACILYQNICHIIKPIPLAEDVAGAIENPIEGAVD